VNEYIQKPRVLVIKQRTVAMYAEMWDGSKILLRRAELETTGSYWVLMSVLLLTAFTFEAYLNHIGPKLFQSWNELERLPPLEKLESVCEKLGISFPPDRRPHQSLVTLFDFRNDLAHGKNQTLSTDELRDNNDNVDAYLGERPKTEWEKLIAWPRIKQVREDVESIIRGLHAAADLDEGDPLFIPGLTLHSASAKVEKES